MNATFQKMLLGAICVSIVPGCDDLGDTFGVSCSCISITQSEARRMNLDFQAADLTQLFDIRAYFGIEGQADSCCGKYFREDNVTGASDALELATVGGNRYLIFSPQSHIAFKDVFLPDRLTLQLWLNPAPNSASGTVMVERIGGDSSLSLVLSDRYRLRLNLPPSSDSEVTERFSADSASSLAVGVWQHIAVTVSDDTVSFYINGTLDSQHTFDKSRYNDLEERANDPAVRKGLCFGSCATALTDLGFASDGMSFRGDVDNIQFNHFASSAFDILANYLSSRGEYQ